MIRWLGTCAPLLLLAVFAGGCGSGREVEVSGEVTASSNAAASAPIRVEFYDVTGEGSERELSLVHSVALDAPGKFDAKADLEGDTVVIHAYVDEDGDEIWSGGEPWGEAEAAIDDQDKAEPVLITLRDGAGPAE